jgi:pimeloyl-ACP methyl ester carboxylesterase
MRERYFARNSVSRRWKRHSREQRPGRKRGGESTSSRFDLPGHGLSGGGGEEDVDRYMEWVRKVVEILSMKNPVIVGHSLGAAITIALALTCGNMLSGIVIVGGGARMPVDQMVFDGIEKDFTGFVDLAPYFSVHKKNRERLRGFLIDNFSQVTPEVFSGDFRSCNGFDVWQRLNSIRIPTLIICGENDKLMPPKYSGDLKERIEDSRLAIIPECGHFPMLEESAAFTALMREFLETLA